MTGAWKVGRKEVGFEVESRELGDRQGRQGSREGLSGPQWPCVRDWSRHGWRRKGVHGRHRGSGDMEDIDTHPSTQLGALAGI